MKKHDFFRLEDFYHRVDGLCSDLLSEYKGCINCRKGCDQCCTGVPIRKTELDYLRSGLENLADPGLLDLLAKICVQKDGSGFTGLASQGPAMEGSDGEAEYRCVFLSAPEGGHCLVYPWRPLICRVHGLPLLYPVEEYDVAGTRIDTPQDREYRMSVCDLNLEGMEDEELLLRGYLSMEDLEQEIEDHADQS